MFSSTPAKLFHLVLFFSICFSACGFWSRANENANVANPGTFTAQEIPSAIPFSTEEPEAFQCDVVISSFAGGERSERRTFTARSGGRRLAIFAAGEASEISLLQLDEARSFSIYQARKVYTETIFNRKTTAANNEAFGDFLTVAWLNAKASAAFESLGAENGLSRFSVRLNNSDASEIVIYVDENLKFPVKQEFYRRAGEQKTLLYTVELKNFQLQADEKLFEPPPKDFRKVSKEEFDKIIWQAKE
jgi:hypothetical protein